MQNQGIPTEREVGRVISRLVMTEEGLLTMIQVATENENNNLLPDDRQLLRSWIQFVQLLKNVLSSHPPCGQNLHQKKSP